MKKIIALIGLLVVSTAGFASAQSTAATFPLTDVAGRYYFSDPGWTLFSKDRKLNIKMKPIITVDAAGNISGRAVTKIRGSRATFTIKGRITKYDNFDTTQPAGYFLFTLSGPRSNESKFWGHIFKSIYPDSKGAKFMVITAKGGNYWKSSDQTCFGK